MQPPYERFEAHCFQFGAHHYLAMGEDPGRLAGPGQGAFTPVCLRYAYPRFETRRPFFPYLTADDWGHLYRGFEAIDWLVSNGLLYPRADAAGVWIDGSQDQVFVKDLDLAVPMTVYAAASEDMAVFPGHAVRAVVEVVANADFAVAPGANVPLRLAAALPAFQMHARVPARTAMALLTAALSDPRRVGLDEVDELL